MTGGVLAEEMQCGRVALTSEEMCVFRCGPDIFGRVSLGLEIDNYRKAAIPFRETGRQRDSSKVPVLVLSTKSGLVSDVPACTGSQRGGEVHL